MNLNVKGLNGATTTYLKLICVAALNQYLVVFFLTKNVFIHVFLPSISLIVEVKDSDESYE